MNISKIVDNMIIEAALGGTKGTRDYDVTKVPGYEKIKPFLGKSWGDKEGTGRTRTGYKTIPCIKCGKKFPSSGPANRICDDCNEVNKQINQKYATAAKTYDSDEND